MRRDVAIVSVGAILALTLAPAVRAAPVPEHDTRSTIFPRFNEPTEPYVYERVELESATRPSVTYGYDVARPATDPEDPVPAIVSIYPLPDKTAETLGWISVTLSPDDVPDFGSFLGNLAHELFLEAILDARVRYPIDPQRVFVGGCSKGAVAGVALAFAFPDLFAGTWGDSGAYDGGSRGSLGMAAQQAPAQPAFLSNSAVILDVVGATPVEAPWSYDALSPHQLIGDAISSGPERHTYAQPGSTTQNHPEELGVPWNGAGMPIALVSGALDPTSPPALTTIPFAKWATAHGYPVRHLAYADGGHCPLYGDPFAAVDLFRWLESNARSRPAAIAYQSADVVNPETHDWPRYDLTGSHERLSLPMQGARRDRGDGLVLDAPHRWRVRIGLRSDEVRQWAGTASVTGGAIVSTSSADDGVGLLGRQRDVAGSTALRPEPSREWFEPGDTLAGSSWTSTTSGAGGDEWDLVTLEVEGGPDTELRVSRTDGRDVIVTLDELRRSVVDDLVRTYDVADHAGLVRLQILQSHQQWWSQLRAEPDTRANTVVLTARNLARARIDLAALNLTLDRTLTLAITGREHTGDLTLALLGDVTGFHGTVRVDGTEIAASAIRRSAGELWLPSFPIAGRTVKIRLEVRP